MNGIKPGDGKKVKIKVSGDFAFLMPILKNDSCDITCI
jgi:hypothetical protein